MVLHALKQGATLITPNKRLANHVMQRFFAEKNHSVQKKPPCFSYSVFLEEAFKQHCAKQPTRDFPLLLSTEQCRYLWWQIMGEQQHYVAFNPGLVSEIQEAWAHCQQWQLPLDAELFSQSPQTQQFQTWAREFEKRLEAMNAITSDLLIDFFIEEKTSFHLSTLTWYCFDHYSPSQIRFQHYLEEQNIELQHIDITALHPPNTFLYQAKEEDDEYQALLQWIDKRLVSNDQHIGIIVPDLQEKKAFLERFFQLYLPQEPINISLGQPLSEIPIVSHALTWLSLCPPFISNHEARLLLYSPFVLSAATEFEQRAQCLQDADCLQEEMISVAAFSAELMKRAPLLGRCLGKMPLYPEKTSAGKWLNHFRERLHHFGFPGEYSLHSNAFQCYQRFLDLLDEFRSLHALKKSMTCAEALEALNLLAQTSIFQAKKPSARVQVLGLLEASGCLFDSLWVMRMTDDCLPQKTRLSAFIPIEWQIKHHLPRANANHEFTLALKKIERLKQSSPIVVFSYAEFADEKPNLPCPLLNDLSPYPASPKRELWLSSSHESYQETYHLPLWPNESIRGGTRLLANQAKCPFRAFAAHRLHLTREATITQGANAMERGQILHHIMEIIWQQLGNQQNLLASSKAQLQALIENAIDTALTTIKKQRPFSFPLLIERIEKRRLSERISTLLAWEKQRPPFIVEALEQSFSMTLGGLILNVRIDRLDKTPGNKKWVIDYKSTLPASTPWQDPRPEEPQLLLYALLDEGINTILFIALKEGEVVCKGLGEENHSLAGLSPCKKDEDWQQLQQGWHAKLEALAQEFMAGECSPKPLNKSICQTCEYTRLCRFTTEAISS